MPRLYQFEKHAPGARRMHEYIAMSAGADFDFVGNQTHPVSFQIFNRCSEIGHAQRNVVQALPRAAQ